MWHRAQVCDFKGCRWPLVVKFADTERDKMAKRSQGSLEYVYAPYGMAPYIAHPVSIRPNLSCLKSSEILFIKCQ